MNAPEVVDGNEKCGEYVAHLIAGASWYPCARPKHHDGGHRAQGCCFKHGVYLGMEGQPPQCPQWPDCISVTMNVPSLQPPISPVPTPEPAGEPLAEVVLPELTLYMPASTNEWREPYDGKGMYFATDVHAYQDATERTIEQLREQLKAAQEEIAHYETAPFFTRNLFENGGKMDGKSFVGLSEEDFRATFEYSDECKCQGCTQIRYLLELRASLSSAQAEIVSERIAFTEALRVLSAQKDAEIAALKAKQD